MFRKLAVALLVMAFSLPLVAQEGLQSGSTPILVLVALPSIESAHRSVKASYLNYYSQILCAGA